MASGPFQAQKVFTYATICSAIVWGFILLVGILAFVGAPDLVGTEIWVYIVYWTDLFGHLFLNFIFYFFPFASLPILHG